MTKFTRHTFSRWIEARRKLSVRGHLEKKARYVNECRCFFHINCRKHSMNSMQFVVTTLEKGV